jgi:hypothetical protein
MMYESKLAAAIKVNGKVLREFNKDTVYIPFGSEYSILLKNLNTKRALVNIFIDGQDIVEGGLVLNAGQEVDLERFVKNGNLTEGNRLKFIERTAGIEQHRGVKLEDGLVRVEFQFEQPARPISWISASGSTNIYPQGSGSYNVGGVMRSVDFSKGENMKAMAASATSATLQSMNISASVGEVHDGMATMDWMPINDAGITVPGSRSDQKFSTVVMGVMEAEKFSMVFKLLGETANSPIQKAVTVKAKPKCVTCGHTNKATAKFCNKCGTALEIYA